MEKFNTVKHYMQLMSRKQILNGIINENLENLTSSNTLLNWKNYTLEEYYNSIFQNLNIVVDWLLSIEPTEYPKDNFPILYIESEFTDEINVDSVQELVKMGVDAMKRNRHYDYYSDNLPAINYRLKGYQNSPSDILGYRIAPASLDKIEKIITEVIKECIAKCPDLTLKYRTYQFIPKKIEKEENPDAYKHFDYYSLSLSEVRHFDKDNPLKKIKEKLHEKYYVLARKQYKEEYLNALYNSIMEDLRSENII